MRDISIPCCPDSFPNIEKIQSSGDTDDSTALPQARAEMSTGSWHNGESAVFALAVGRFGKRHECRSASTAIAKEQTQTSLGRLGDITEY